MCSDHSALQETNTALNGFVSPLINTNQCLSIKKCFLPEWPLHIQCNRPLWSQWMAHSFYGQTLLSHWFMICYSVFVCGIWLCVTLLGLVAVCDWVGSPLCTEIRELWAASAIPQPSASQPSSVLTAITQNTTVHTRSKLFNNTICSYVFSTISIIFGFQSRVVWYFDKI